MTQRRVLITGGAGYVGVHSVLEFRARGWWVGVVDNLTTGHAEFAAHADAFEQLDLRDRDALGRAVASMRPDGVLHCAALTEVGASVADPTGYLRHNLVSTLNLIDAAVENGAVPIVFSSSAAVYGEPRVIPIPEDHPRDPINPYGFTKYAAEEALFACERAHGLRAICLRYFNAAGADPAARVGEWHEPETHVIPNVLRAARDPAFRFRLFGTDYPTRDGTCVRDFVHVADLAAAHALALEALWAGAPSAAYNVGSGQGNSLRELIAAVERVVGRPIPVDEGPRRAGDPASLVAATDRVQAELGWSPRFGDLETIVAHAWAWELARAAR